MKKSYTEDEALWSLTLACPFWTNLTKKKLFEVILVIHESDTFLLYVGYSKYLAYEMNRHLLKVFTPLTTISRSKGFKHPGGVRYPGGIVFYPR